MLEEIDVFYRSDSSVVGSCGNMLLIGAMDAPTLEDVKAVERLGTQLAEQWTSGFGILLTIPAAVSPPQGDARNNVTQIMRSLAPHMRCLGAAILGEGFGAAAKRSVISFLMMALKTDCPSKSFSTPDEAVEWVADKCEDGSEVRFHRANLRRNLETQL